MFFELILVIYSPARFYVSVITKMVLTHLLVEYEFKLEDPMARPCFSFGKARLPNPFMTLLVRKRVPEESAMFAVDAAVDF